MIRYKKMTRFISAFLSATVIMTSCLVSVGTKAEAAPKYNYAEALQKTILFYEAQRSGSISTSSIPTRLPWRGDAQLTDGQDVGLDLTGGWVDAGDNMKYVSTMGATASCLAWGAIEYKDAYVKSGQLKWLLNQLRWVNDFFIKAHPSANVFYGQVGMTASDHNAWIPIESTAFVTDRSAIKLDSAHPGTDIVAGVAAAMASSSILFRETDSKYADTLLSHAIELFKFGETYKGSAVDTLDAVDKQTPYRSWSGYDDELCWGAIWLYKAMEAKASGSGEAYLEKAESLYNNLGKEANQSVHKYKWSHCYDDSTFGCYIMMAKIKPENELYRGDAERWLNWWTVGGTEHNADGTKVSYTPGGHARADSWGSLRYAANTALSAFIYSDFINNAEKKSLYHDFAVKQINYILGDNPREGSYIVGFGNDSPQHPHHRSAQGSWGQKQDVPSEHRHILYGALVGSPTSSDEYNDAVDDYVSNEVAIDYNSCLVGGLARMYQEFGGTAIPDSEFPLPDKPHTSKDEWPVFAKMYYEGIGGMNLSVLPENRSSWPTRPSNQLKARYFFTLDADSPDDVTIDAGNGVNVGTVTGPHLWDAETKTYYIEFDMTGTWLMPGYDYERGGPDLTIMVNSKSGSWDSGNDWSRKSWDDTYVNDTYQYGPNICLYEGDVLLNGNEPGGSGQITPTKTPTSTPEKIIYGDVSGDGKVDSGDYTLMRRYLLGIIKTLPADNWEKAGDLNQDGKVDSGDYTLMRKYLLGILTKLPI